MCYNPSRLLCVRGMYKGVIKTAILFKCFPEEYEQGYAIRNIEDLSTNTLILCRKIDVVKSSGFVIFNERIELPCRKCLECTRNRAKEWSVRCQLEAMQFPENTNFMVTLTYRDSSLPMHTQSVYDSESDSYILKRSPTLSIEDCQKFMKALRKPFERKGHTNIRFFSCGEYGAKTRRPHYHFILFNLPLDDLSYFGLSKSGFPLYRSKTIEKAWQHGFVYVQPFSFECARYVAQYCVKKLSKDELLLGVKPEFINMSRRPAIGMNWFYKNMEQKIRLIDGIPNDHLFLPQRFKDGTVHSVKYKIPSAFTRKFKPITDSKRGIDTEIPDIAYMLNIDEEMFIDAMEEIKAFNDSSLQAFIESDLHRYGFTIADTYTDKYKEYLKIKERHILSKFTPKRIGV